MLRDLRTVENVCIFPFFCQKWGSNFTTVINDWAKILDNRGQVDTFILDFEKAFDTPPHELLKTSLTFKYLIEHLLADFSYSRPLYTYL